MFDKLKKIKELKRVQSQLKSETAESEKEGVRVIVNGEMLIQEVQISPNLTKKRQEDVLTECINESIRKVQMKIAEKMSKMQKS